MAASKPLGTYGNGVGTVTPLAHKLANAALVVKQSGNLARAGLFYNGTDNIVTGKAIMSYDVAAFSAALSRGATAGAVFLANDGVVTVATTAAPGSNSRYDVIYVWAREYSLDGVDSNPVIGVIQGTAAASPTVPSLAAFPGALELARVIVPAGVTATNTGTTITQTAPFTAMAGGIVPFRTKTDADLWTTATANQRVSVLADNSEWIRVGAAWKAIGVAAFASASAYANGAGTIASATYAALPTVPVSLSVVATVACQAMVTWNCRGSAAAGYINVGVAVSGATTIAATESAPGVTPAGILMEFVNSITVQVTVSKLVSLNAGTNTFTVQALLGGAGGTKIVYHPYLTVVPVS